MNQFLKDFYTLSIRHFLQILREGENADQRATISLGEKCKIAYWLKIKNWILIIY